MSMNRFVSLNPSAGRQVSYRMRRGLLRAPLFYLLLMLLQATSGSRVSVAQQSGNSTQLYSRDLSSIDQGNLTRALNADRQKKLVADTIKLLNLATALNAELSSANAASLTPDQLRRVAEMEKLAHSVREKMGTAWSEPPQSPFSAVFR